ncbi:uncharacterized protein CELE_W05H12.4 [Caenorhabditis elegans]|uniref:Uncharacterized protein n=1 Tax=Caenorhabditis elegans TaxID=6239 RepID=G3MU70_CAEEL|nr:Uncharacterized protein CELE_W05H12.4 [Caenorhabditis elegans]CCD31128.1 Uncharacterized protein CELE_W05H12.4 [Caenorhabditis elegans]|eukprot:NP_001252159.1 Uncharacterized protein CELE_W05H12.4 [Caenorhabditis elegans]
MRSTSLTQSLRDSSLLRIIPVQDSIGWKKSLHSKDGKCSCLPKLSNEMVDSSKFWFVCLVDTPKHNCLGINVAERQQSQPIPMTNGKMCGFRVEEDW